MYLQQIDHGSILNNFFTSSTLSGKGITFGIHKTVVNPPAAAALVPDFNCFIFAHDQVLLDAHAHPLNQEAL